MKIERLQHWSQEAEEGLCYALAGDRDIIAAQVNAGRLECFRLWDGAAYMVTRVQGGVLTVCCYQGERAKEACEWVFERARLLGLERVRFHTSRPALARLLSGFGFEHREHVFEAKAA
jgi:hypothetical protein